MATFIELHHKGKLCVFEINAISCIIPLDESSAGITLGSGEMIICQAVDESPEEIWAMINSFDTIMTATFIELHKEGGLCIFEKNAITGITPYGGAKDGAWISVGKGEQMLLESVDESPEKIWAMINPDAKTKK